MALFGMTAWAVKSGAAFVIRQVPQQLMFVPPFNFLLIGVQDFGGQIIAASHGASPTTAGETVKSGT
jgi:hypothetical protein